ncbi:response regulator transcription factor [Sodalinema gerasimenkoae]|uniref:response regulator transcription factor n=1 Tax=Sodalinema gerasimenkoae TaxID=2862348 RepID=UPI00135A30B0|nr:response regulator [Sodalinema gerasimenkoae]
MTTILVVDDVESERAVMSSILEDEGWTVQRASDGDEAIAQIRSHPPDLVVLDVIMPRMNGFEVIRELRANPKTQTLPVIFCSQKNTDIDRSWGSELGADAYLGKPFAGQQLVEIIERLLSGSRR